MLARRNRTSTTVLLGFLSGGVAVMLVCASQPTEGLLCPAQCERATADLQPQVVACLYSESTDTEFFVQASHAIDGEPAVMPMTDVTCHEEASIYAPNQPSDATDPTATPVPASIYSQASAATDPQRPMPADVSPMDDETEGGTLPVEISSPAEDMTPATVEDLTPASGRDCLTTERGAVERVCSLREANSREVVATVRMSGAVMSEQLTMNDPCSAQPDHRQAADSRESVTATVCPSTARAGIRPSATDDRADSGAPVAEYFCAHQADGEPQGGEDLVSLPACEEAAAPPHDSKVCAASSVPSKVQIRFDRPRQMVTLDAPRVTLATVLDRIEAETGEVLHVPDSFDRAGHELFDLAGEGPTLLEALRSALENCGFTLDDDGERLSVVTLGQASTNPVRNVSFQQAHDPPPGVETAIATSSVSRRIARLPEPWELVENSVANDDQSEPELPPGIMSATVVPGELEVARRARAMVATGALNETIDLLSQAVIDYPESAILYRMLGEAYMWRDDYAAASQALEHSISINKMDPLTNNLFAETLMKLGQEVRADHYRYQALDAGNGSERRGQ